MKTERIHERNELGDLMSLAMFSYSLPQKLALEVDALFVFPGLGEDVRIIQPVQAYWENEKTKNKFFLVAGHNKEESMWKEFTPESLAKAPFSIKKTEGLYTETHFANTKEQALWVIEMIEKLSITSCAIIATPFHLVRAYATVLASMEAASVRIPIIPIPVFVSPEVSIPEIGESAWEMLQGEVDRIRKYQEKEDVVSYDTFREYINWLWQQPIVKNNI